MKTRIAALIATLALLGAIPTMASARAAAEVKAVKGSIQVTLRLQKTTVKVKRALWYKLELKNVGKKKLRVDDWIFKNPWAMHENCRMPRGIYLEIIDPEGNPLTARAGGDRAHYDWEPKEGELLPYTAEEKMEISALQADWKRRGLTPQQQSLALNDWNNKNNQKKNRAELKDSAKQLWLEPGASTSTFAWMNRGPGEYAGRAEDDESLRSGYTQLWSYRFLDPGKYRIRAVYDHDQPKSTRALFKKHGESVDPGWIKFKTPFIEFEVQK